MEPASIVSLVAFAGSCVNVIGRAAYSLQQAPAEIMALQNELSDLRVLLTVWSGAIRASSSDRSTIAPLNSSEEELLAKLAKLLDELSTLTKTLYKSGADGRHHFQRTHWLRRKSKVVLLKSEISRTTQVLRDIVALRNDLRSTLSSTKLDRIELTQLSMHGLLTKLSTLEAERQQTTTAMRTITTSTVQMPNNDNASISLSARLPKACHVRCPCSCHYRLRRNTSTTINQIVGRLFVGYVGLPNPNSFCDAYSCSSSQVRSLRVVYTFPYWFVRATVDTVLGRDLYGNPELSIRIQNRREFHAANSLFYLAKQGQADEMKRVLSNKLASPFDITYDGGRTAFAVWRHSVQSLTHADDC